MPSKTLIEGKLALRPCFVGARAETSQVDGLIEAVLRIGSELVYQKHKCLISFRQVSPGNEGICDEG